MLSFLRSHFLDNPLVGRQLTTAFTGSRLGFAFLLVNVALLLTYLGVFVSFIDAPLAPVKGTGLQLHFFHNTVLYFLLALLLPIKVSGAIEGPRFGRAFDQLVVTGVSPLRFHLGNWGTGLIYALLIMVATLPFAGCMAIFGGVSAGKILQGYAILLVYSNVIIAVTLALSVFEREWLTAPLAVGAFWLLGVLGLIMDRDWVWGFPLHVAEITPLRYFWREVRPYEIFWADARTYEHVLGDPVLFSVTIPLSIYPFLLWGGIILAGTLCLLIGPAHRFTRGLNNFGAVILPGDRRKRFLRRLRWGLNRRVELAFFYENRPRWCDRWDFLLRIALITVPIVLLWGVILGRAYGGVPLPRRAEFFHDEFMVITLILNGVTVLLWIILFTDPRYRVYDRERVGALRLPRELALLGCFLLLLLCLFAVQYWMWAEMQSNYRGLLAKAGVPAPVAGATDPRGNRGYIPFESFPVPVTTDPEFERYRERWWAFIPGILFLLLNIFLLSRILSRGAHGLLVSRVVSAIGVAALIFLPMIVLGFVISDWLPDGFMGLASLTPLVLVDEISEIPWTAGERTSRYFLAQGVLSTALLTCLALLHLLHRRSERRRAGAAPAAAVGLAIGLGLAGGSALPGEEEPAEYPRSDVPVVIEEEVRGFEGSVFAPGVDFFTVKIRNDGGETVEGNFRVREGPIESPPRRFELGPRSTRVLRWSPDTELHQEVVFWRGGGDMASSIVEVKGLRIETEPRSVAILSSLSSRGGRGAQEEAAVLSVGVQRDALREWAKSGLRQEYRHVVECRPEYLPENPMAYGGISVVLIGPVDLSLWTGKQRRALRDYVRLGGSVIFHGGLDRSGLAGAGEWKEILRTRSSRKTSAGALFRLEELEEGRVALELDGADGTSPIPLLFLRQVGFGHVGHLSFDLDAPGLAEKWVASRKFWSDLHGALPRSRFPFLISGGHGDTHLWDLGSMYSILGYFTFYALFLGCVLIFFFRRRSRRRLVWFATPAISLLFLAAVPLLNDYLHGRPSFAEYHELTYLPPAARRGVSLGHLRIRSSGRQEHRLAVRGDALSTFRFDIPRYFLDRAGWTGYLARRTGSNRTPGPPGRDGAHGMDLNVTPWARREYLFVGDAIVPEPIEGAAVATRKTGQLTYRVRLPENVDPARVWLFAFGILPGDFLQVRSARLRAEPGGFHAGTVRLDPSFPSFDEKEYFHDARQFPLVSQYMLAWHMPRAPRVALAWAAADGGGVAIDSPDLRFERPLSKSDHDRLLRFGGPAVERDGAYFRRLHHRVVLQELPLEIR